MTELFNQSKHLKRRRELRANMPPAEVLLWKRLRNRQVGNAKFRRQFGIGRYVVDFYCPEVRLAIELDGLSHQSESAAVYDTNRQAEIEALSIHLLRFNNQKIYDSLDAVVETIFVTVEELKRSI